jgi:signal transduction histidine kinase
MDRRRSIPDEVHVHHDIEIMADAQVITAVRPSETRSYVGTERRGIGAPRLGVTAGRLRLGALAAVSVSAMGVHLIGWRSPADPIGGALPASLAGLSFAAAILYCFRFRLLRDAYSLEIGITIAFCSLTAGAILVFADRRSSAAPALASVAAMASLVVLRTLRRPVVNSQLRLARRMSSIVLLLGSTGALAFWAQAAARATFGTRSGTYLSTSIGVVGATVAIVVAHYAIRMRREIVFGAASCLYLASVSAILASAEPRGDVALALVILLAMSSVETLETSAIELWSAFAHEERRLFDLFVLSQEQQTVLDAERTAGATRRHDQKATVLAIEGAISALANDATNEFDPHTRDHLASAVRAELARLRRGLERSQSVEVRPVALREVLTPMVVCMRSEGVNVRLAVPAGMVVETNTDCLLEIIQNLVDNAATHGKNRSIVITASVDGSGFGVAVSDRGPGVPEALRDVIFERGVTSRAADHSGLGLFSAAQLAARLGGTLGVEPGPRGGARFVLTVAPTARGLRDVG